MKVTDIMFYNSYMKIAGDVVTFKTYSETQPYAYLSKYVQGISKNITPAELEKIKKERFEKSCRRAKSKIFDLVACNANEHVDHEGKRQTVKFLTLTFKENVTDLESANGEVTKFIKRLSYHAYKINKNVIKYICVPELQQRGVWHYHIILFNLKYIPWYQLVKIWGLGGVYINALKNGLDGTTVAKYVTKYISKGIIVGKNGNQTNVNENGEKEGDKRLSDYYNYKKHNMQNKKRYQCSRGLKRPIETRQKITRAEHGQIANFIMEYAKKDKKGNKKIYFDTYKNDYRGQINVLVVEVEGQAKNVIKTITDIIYNDNRYKMSRNINVKWGKIRHIIFNKLWECGNYEYLY